MWSTMMSLPLNVVSLLRHADCFHGDTQIVTREPWDALHRATYRETHGRARRLTAALRRLGVEPGTCVGSLAWNTHRHFELYFGAAGSGLVLNTINPRLFPEQIRYIIRHASDRVVFFDVGFAPLVARLVSECPQVRAWIALCDPAHLPEIDIPVACYEELLAAEGEDFVWPELDENTACALCYTSGTTGNPKGVLYSQRSTVLHAFAVALPDAMNVSAREVVMPVVPMFHVNAWGLPYASAMTGAKLVLPGAKLDGASLFELIEHEGVTLSAGVPTVWMDLLRHVRAHGLRFSTLRRVVIGGAACPPALMECFAEYGVEVLHAWGMTELSPLGVLNQVKAKHAALPEAERAKLRLKQGRPVFGVEMKIVDDAGAELPRDGRTSGELLVRGPWIAAGYYGGEGGDVLRDGWFPTGDVATLDADGYLQITDRAKDVIKSGGEWISSVELENLAVAHPDVVEAAVIGVPHPRWSERPLLVLVCKEGRAPTREEMREFLRGKVAKWWLPDEVVCVDSLPHTATGKLSKVELRKQFAGYRWTA